MRSLRYLDWMGLKKPLTWARHNRAASTKRMTSAGLLLPSLFRRSIKALSSASIRLILIPVDLVKLEYKASSV